MTEREWMEAWWLKVMKKRTFKMTKREKMRRNASWWKVDSIILSSIVVSLNTDRLKILIKTARKWRRGTDFISFTEIDPHWPTYLILSSTFVHNENYYITPKFPQHLVWLISSALLLLEVRVRQLDRRCTFSPCTLSHIPHVFLEQQIPTDWDIVFYYVCCDVCKYLDCT